MKSLKVLLLMIGLSTAVVSSADTQVVSLSNIDNTQKVHDVETFLPDIIKSSKPVIILVSTTWCPPCKFVKPLFLQVAQEMAQDCEFICVDGDENLEILMQLEVNAFPTFIFYIDGMRINLDDVDNIDNVRAQYGFIDRFIDSMNELITK